jgi:DNA-binding NarL/FixJ family response regulator
MNLRNGLPLLTAIILCLHVSPVIAQKLSLSDSLSQVLQRKDLSLKDRVVTMGLLGESKAFADDPEGIRIEREALKLYRQLNDPEVAVSIYSHLVLLHARQEDLKNASVAVDSMFYYANQSGKRKMLGIAWYRKTWIEHIGPDRNAVVKSGMEALKYLEGTDGYKYVASVCYMLSSVYAGWGDLVLQGEYARRCLKAALKDDDLDRIMWGYQKVANYFQFAYVKDLKNHVLLDSALYYNRIGIRFFTAHREKIIYQTYLGITSFNIACLYQRDYVGNYNKDSLDHYLGIALRASIAVNDRSITSMCYALMSDAEMEKRNFQGAEALMLKALALNLEDSTTYPRDRVQILKGLANIAEKSGAYAKALKYYKDYHKLYEDFYDAEKLELAKDLETKYQSEKDKDALAELTRIAALNRKLTYLYIALFITLGIALLFIVRSLRFRLKATVHQKKLLEIEREESVLLAQIRTQENKRLELEKQEAELHARLKEEEAMRLQAERQLLQERQERLQMDLLAGSLQVEQKDEILQAVQKKIEESNHEPAALRQINKIIDQNKKVDENFASYKADFDNIRPEFFEKLREKSGNTLSRLELKHCAYISMGLTNKEVALRLGVAPKTVVMARYRIKIKLGLGKDENIDEYIMTLR